MASKPIKVNNDIILNQHEMKTEWADCLYKSKDGAALKSFTRAGLVPQYFLKIILPNSGQKAPILEKLHNAKLIFTFSNSIIVMCHLNLKQNSIHFIMTMISIFPFQAPCFHAQAFHFRNPSLMEGYLFLKQMSLFLNYILEITSFHKSLYSV